MEDPNANLMDFIFALVERLMLTSPCPREHVRALVEPILGDVAVMRAQYAEGACPPSAVAVRMLMDDMLGLYEQSLLELVDYLDDEDDEHLRAAVSLAEEANDLMSAIEDVIQTNKNLLSDMVEG